jgi:gluconate 2-dehydrogenase gamma chain
MSIRSNNIESGGSPSLGNWRAQVVDRRRFLLGLAGGSLSLLLPLPSHCASPNLSQAACWRLIETVQDHLFPSEPEAPGAREINALTFLKWVVSDNKLDPQERAFILRGCEWLEALSLQRTEQRFVELAAAERDALLEQIARSEAGENWLSTLLLYIFEALLSDPIYGGNPDSIGWRWLKHRPGFPRPDDRNRYRAG